MAGADGVGSGDDGVGVGEEGVSVGLGVLDGSGLSPPVLSPGEAAEAGGRAGESAASLPVSLPGSPWVAARTATATVMTARAVPATMVRLLQAGLPGSMAA